MRRGRRARRTQGRYVKHSAHRLKSEVVFFVRRVAGLGGAGGHGWGRARRVRVHHASAGVVAAAGVGRARSTVFFESCYGRQIWKNKKMRGMRGGERAGVQDRVRLYHTHHGLLFVYACVEVK